MTRSSIAALGPLLGVLVACTELPPAPGAGTDAGMGGHGGAIACSGITWSRTVLLEDDGVAGGVATGTVSQTSDPVDRWGVTGCGGPYDIELLWEDMMQGFDLDLVLLDESKAEVARGTMGGQNETLAGVELTAGEQFFVEVRAVNTFGVNDLNYDVVILRSE